jgi:hypothetical protein
MTAASETARKNHEQLFPGHVSTLKVTDPELRVPFIGYPRTLNALAAVNEIAPAPEEGH